MSLFDGKVAIVTGAGGGIGRAHALAFAAEGASVVVNDLGGARDGTGAGASMAESVAAEIRGKGGQSVADTHSVSEPESAEAIIQTAIDRFGRLDVLINNAGILRDKTILKMTGEHWDTVQDVHLRGSFFCLRAACRVMAGQKTGGSIVNTTSTSGLFGNFGQANYGAAKSGVAGLTRVAALEMAKHGIRVNAIAPVAKTRMTQELDAVADALGPEWIPPLVLHLASD
ncbi:MAG: SDR family NAD(P)-dependent oxidoreductase, partial [bacterium]|nr:SDR family NAD(P)-dependent oxidoreductase [bacterium]